MRSRRGERLGGEREGVAEIRNGEEKELSGPDAAVVRTSADCLEGLDHRRWPLH